MNSQGRGYSFNVCGETVLSQRTCLLSARRRVRLAYCHKSKFIHLVVLGPSLLSTYALKYLCYGERNTSLGDLVPRLLSTYTKINTLRGKGLGIVNGKEAIEADAVIDESAKVYSVGHNVWIVDSPPKSLLVQIQDPKFTQMHSLLAQHPRMEGYQCKACQREYCQYFLQVLKYRSNRQKRISIRCRQVPCCAGCAITDYRPGKNFQ